MSEPQVGGLHVAGLSVVYGERTALHDVHLDLGPGSLLAVTGPSGAGKSSLLWALGGALEPASVTGTVAWDGGPVTDRTDAAARGVVLMPQGNALASALTARENLLVPLAALGVPAADAAGRALAALSAVGLDESADHLVEELSGGQQQRVAVARTVAARGTLLLVDEPTSDLDAGNRERVMTLLRAEADRGAVVVMATHDPEAADATDGELALDDGAMRWVRIVQGHGEHPPFTGAAR